MRKTTVYLPESTDRRMRQAAQSLGKSRAQLTRAALEEYLERCESERGLPPSIGMGDNPTTPAAGDEERLARYWGSE